MNLLECIELPTLYHETTSEILAWGVFPELVLTRAHLNRYIENFFPLSHCDVYQVDSIGIAYRIEVDIKNQRDIKSLELLQHYLDTHCLLGHKFHVRSKHHLLLDIDQLVAQELTAKGKYQ